MIKKMMITTVLGVLCYTNLAMSADFSNQGTPSSYETISMELNARSRLGFHCCRPRLPKGHAADGVKFNYCKGDVSSTYQQLYKFILPFIPTLTTLAHNATDQTTYQLLLDESNLLVAAYNQKYNLSSARLVVCDPDGLVLVDTSKGVLNTYANAQAGSTPATFADAVNVSHNTRISVLDAQSYEIGVGVETKFSNSVGVDQSYVAVRLGSLLHNDGTVRISQNAE